mgnify:CR=1 FL=1
MSKFKIGDYVKHKEHPKSEVILHLTEDMHVQVINAQSENYEHATQEEIEEYHRKWSDD